MAKKTNQQAQSQKVKTQTTVKTTPQQVKSNPENESENQQSKQSKTVNKAKYDRYTSLKFLEIALADSGNPDPSKNKLPENVKKELTELEAEIMKCEGVKPIKTMTAAIDHEIIKMVEGVPLPVEYSDIIKNKDQDKPGTAQLYFG